MTGHLISVCSAFFFTNLVIIPGSVDVADPLNYLKLSRAVAEHALNVLGS